MIPQAVSILFGAAFTAAVMLALGHLLLSRLRLQFRRQEQHLFAFVGGAACLSLIVFLLACVHGARKGIFLALGVAVLALAFRNRPWRAAGDPLPPLSRTWRVFFALLFAIFGYLYFLHAMAPETSPDGVSYHLGLVSRYARAHGFYRITTDMYANLSQGVELLYLFAYAFGRHSAASLVHFSFLLALPLTMVCYARRFGFPAAGITGALLVYLSPIVGWDGSTAYIDVAVACVLFAIFYLLQIWDEDRKPGLLVLIGLLAGFAYAMKYTAFLAVPYAAGFVAWKTLRKGRSLVRPLATIALCAFVMIAPWVIRNWIWYGNPFSPFYNSWFPNPYIHIGLEQGYRERLSHWNGVTDKLQIPVEVAVRGEKLQGVLGPMFLLAPIALLALRYRQGRQLLLAAAVYLSTYPANIGTRFLIPALPFLSLAMGLVLMNWKAMAPLLLLAHALSAWPPCLKSYCGQYALRLQHVPWRAALRIEPEDRYLGRVMPEYGIARMIEANVPPGAKVLANDSPAEAYTSRDILVGYAAALNNNLADMLKAPRIRDWQPTRRLTFHFPLQSLRRVRVLQTAPRGPKGFWSISEFRVFSGSRELPRDPRWRIRADPNPFEIQLAFDNNPMTRWRSWEPLFPGAYVELDFGGAETIDSVVLDSTRDQWAVQLRLEGQGAAALWGDLAQAPEASDIPAPSSMRQMISRELRWQGIEYLLIAPSDVIAQDLRANTTRWGVTLVAERNGARLYRIK